MNNERPDDDTLRQAYRQLASETTPADLDNAVLDMAAKHARQPRYSRSVRWTRPLAWAATIALCLAITLEITRLPAPDAVPVTPASPERSLQKKSQPVPAAMDEPDLVRSEAEALAAPARKESYSFDVKDADMVERAAEQARLQRGANLQLGRDEARVAEPVASGLATPAKDCAEDDRSAPESWLACIESLQAAGDAEAAAAQTEQLRKAFPDFELP